MEVVVTLTTLPPPPSPPSPKASRVNAKTLLAGRLKQAYVIEKMSLYLGFEKKNNCVKFCKKSANRDSSQKVQCSNITAENLQH